MHLQLNIANLLEVIRSSAVDLCHPRKCETHRHPNRRLLGSIDVVFFWLIHNFFIAFHMHSLLMQCNTEDVSFIHSFYFSIVGSFVRFFVLDFVLFVVSIHLDASFTLQVIAENLTVSVILKSVF